MACFLQRSTAGGRDPLVGHSTMVRHIAMLVSAILIGSIGLSGCADERDNRLPPELLGRWRTRAPKYHDRYFELRADAIAVFGLGGRNKETSSIVDVELIRDGDFLQYHITHLNEVGETYRFSLSYHIARPNELTFVNQPNIIWTKVYGAAPF